jgi:hypothetical protein
MAANNRPRHPLLTIVRRPDGGDREYAGPGLVDLAAGEETIWDVAATPARMVHTLTQRLIDLGTMLLGRPGGVSMRYGAAERCPVNTSRSMPTATMLPSSIFVVATCREDLHQCGDQHELLILGVLGGRRRGVGHAHVVAAGGRSVSGGYPAGWRPVPGVRYAHRFGGISSIASGNPRPGSRRWRELDELIRPG